MSRLVALLSFATLSLLASCVDLKLPAKISQCEQDHTCTNGGATAGKGGATAGTGGTGKSSDAGASDVTSGGKGGNGGGIAGTSGTGGQASGGSSTLGGSTSTTGGSGGGEGGQGGNSGSADAGGEPTPDAQIDKPLANPDVYPDTPKADGSPDSVKTGPEVSAPDSRPDASPDLPPDVGFDAGNCIQVFKGNGYALTVPGDAGVKACSDCKENGVSKEATCKGMVDCLVTAWVCNSRLASCWTTCRNTTPGGDMVVDDCVAALVSKACP